MAMPKDNLSKVSIRDGGNFEQMIYHTVYETGGSEQHGFAVAIVRPGGAGKRKRIAMRWTDDPKKPLGFPNVFGKSVWFEVPDWMEEAVLKIAAQQAAKEIAEEDLA